jgi:CRISPR/Cas system-associated endoribonuclease Cas2
MTKKEILEKLMKIDSALIENEDNIIIVEFLLAEKKTTLDYLKNKTSMTLKEKFNALVPKEFGGMQEPLLSDCEKIADDYAIEILEHYHNSLFNIPLKEVEAKRIVEHIKKQNEN